MLSDRDEIVPIARDRAVYITRSRPGRMSDTDLLGVVLGGIALLMFLTGIVLVV